MKINRRNRRAIELADLGPIRDVGEWLAAWIENDRKLRPTDPVRHALEQVLKRLNSGIADAANPEMELTPKQKAKALGITVDAMYKRQQRARSGERSEASSNSNARAVAKAQKDAAEQAA